MIVESRMNRVSDAIASMVNNCKLKYKENEKLSNNRALE